MSGDMRRNFTGREDLVAYLRAEFPEAAAVDDHVSPIPGGRQAAEDTLAAIDPAAYARSRNYLDGAVTRLSPYLRHGVLGMAEARDAAMMPGAGRNPGKLVQELGWRDYYQRIYAQIGADIWADREPYKTGYAAGEYADDLPAEILAGETGLACIDACAQELAETGYLHNHARMYVAGYVVHWRRVKWQAGAHWFLQHLLDGDPASNNLSWQWVASTFSHKPYFYNRENVEKYTAGRYCRDCPLYGHCDFEGSYPALERRLFPNKPAEPQRKSRSQRRKQEKGKRR